MRGASLGLRPFRPTPYDEDKDLITIRRGPDRGHFDHGWLDTHHTFSFGDYRDEAHMGFRNLRVINEDFVQAGRGFSTHGHRDMEILSFVLRGALAHQDSMGNGSIIRPGEVQRMSAGKGVLHSEKNPSEGEVVQLLQVWIIPDQAGGEPSYEQKAFAPEQRADRLALLVAPDGRDGAVSIQADAFVFGSDLSPGKSVQHALEPGRHAWVQVTVGELEVLGQRLVAGDGAAISDEGVLSLRAGEQGAEFLVFDLR